MTAKYQTIAAYFKARPQEIVDLSLYNDEKPPNIESYVKPDDKLTMEWKANDFNDTRDPRVWGPAVWFFLHNSAVYYPQNASLIVQENMKNLILGLEKNQ